MSEQELYGVSQHLTNLRLLKDPDKVGEYKTFVDGHELQGVTSVDVSFRPNEPIQAEITLDSVTKIDHDVLARFKFEPTTLKECMKFISLELQLNEEFAETFESLIVKGAEQEGITRQYSYEIARSVIENFIDAPYRYGG